MPRKLILLASIACFVGAALAAMPLMAQTAPGGDIDPSAVGAGLVDAISSGQWGLVVGLAIMLIVWAIRTFAWPAIPPAALPWLATAIGALAAGGAALVADPSRWLPAILAGIQAGLSAAGTWGLLKVARKKLS